MNSDDDLVEYVEHPLYGEGAPMMTREEAEALKRRMASEG